MVHQIERLMEIYNRAWIPILPSHELFVLLNQFCIILASRFKITSTCPMEGSGGLLSLSRCSTSCTFRISFGVLFCQGLLKLC